MSSDNILYIFACFMVMVSVFIISLVLKWAPSFSVSGNDHIKERVKKDEATQSMSNRALILTIFKCLLIGFIAVYIYSVVDNNGLFLFGLAALVLMLNSQKRTGNTNKTDQSRLRIRLESVISKATKVIAMGVCIDSIIVHVHAWINWWFNDSYRSDLPVLVLSCSLAFMLASIFFLMKIRIMSVMITLCMVVCLCIVGFIPPLWVLGIIAGGISP